ncbi:RNA polymerase sigma factor [Dongia deserti]|uniref:RNA polymerase sigma factor n=1 Tax=Dongia deserti TaxID=2268030 RepID=UPI000E647170|nr:sigma-70 family RNA polymerase sigma factor [Dongia deserti]
MPPERSRRPPPLALVESPPSAGQDLGRSQFGSGAEATAKESDWSNLMARAQAGDSGAYRRLLEQVAPYVRSLAVRMSRDPSDVEEAVQDVLLTIHAIRDTYDPRRPFGPWLVAIAHRRIVDWLRRRGRTRSRETAMEPRHETFPARPTNIDEASSDRRALRAAVESLPPAQRQAIKLLKLQQMSLKEAAAVSGTSIASLKVATHRALKGLRRILAGRSEDA